MPLSRRYSPEVAPGEVAVFGMDFSTIIPPGVGIQAATIDVFTNTNPPVEADQLHVERGTVSWIGRTVYATIKAHPAATGIDYQILWTAVDTDGNTWPRTALVLCAPTS